MTPYQTVLFLSVYKCTYYSLQYTILIWIVRKTIEDLTSEKNSLLQANKALSSSVRDLNERIYSLEYDLEDKDEEIAQLRASDQEYKPESIPHGQAPRSSNDQVFGRCVSSQRMALWVQRFYASTNERESTSEGTVSIREGTYCCRNEVLQARVREYEKMVKEHEEEDRSLQHYTVWSC